jgi:hypothetical protein
VRTCGDCTLCCKLVPVRDKRTGLNKDANTKCRHQSHARGCGVYNTVAMPMPCRMWSCRWVAEEPGTEKLSRPDRSGYVLDLMPDFVTAVDNDTGETRKIEIIQVWIDPRRPDAHRDPALRAYLGKLAQQGVAALIRRDAEAGFILAPNTATGGWEEIGAQSTGETHSAEEVIDAIGSVQIKVIGGGKKR